MSLPVRRLEPAAILPTRAHADDAGLDLYALEDSVVPAGHVGLVCDRSSLAKRGLKTAGGVIDAGYRGEVGVVVWNLSREPQAVKKGERAAQLLVVPIATPAPVESADLGATTRGGNGFGSTGR